MKINCGPDKKEWERRRRLKRIEESKWHRVFAWRPVRLGPDDCRWLEFVERRDTNVKDRGSYHVVFGRPEYIYRSVGDISVP